MRALHKMGYMYFNVGNYSLSIAKYLQAVDLAKSIGDKQTEGRIYINMAYVYYKVGRNNEAITFADKGAYMTENDTLKAWAYNCISKAYYAKKVYDSAAVYSKLAFNINEVINHSAAVLNINNTAYALYQNKEYISALRQIRNISTFTHDKVDIARMHNFKGSCFFMMGKLDSAETNYKISIYLAPEARTFLNYAELLYKTHRETEAKEMLYLGINLKPELKHLSETLSALGMYKDALVVRDCFEVRAKTNYEELCNASYQVQHTETTIFKGENKELSKNLAKAERELDHLYFWFFAVAGVLTALAIGLRLYNSHIFREPKKRAWLWFNGKDVS